MRTAVSDPATATPLAVDAHVAGVALADLGDGVADVLGQGSAVGVAEHEELRAGGAGGLERLQGVAGVGRVAVKEVLRIKEHGLARAHEELHGVKDHVEVVLQRGAQDVRDVKVPGLSKDRRALAPDARKHVEPGVLVGAHADPVGRSKGDKARMLGPPGAQPLVEFGVLGVAGGVSRLDEVHADLVQPLENLLLILQGKGHGLPLRAVAQRRIVEKHPSSLLGLSISAGPWCCGSR